MAIFQGNSSGGGSLVQQENNILGSIPSGSGSNPLSTTSEDALKVSGIGALLGMNWGPVTVAQAIGGFNQLAKKSQTSIQAKAQLIQLQEEMYAAGLYGGKKPKLGTLTAGEDDKAFRNMAVGAAQSGQPANSYLTGQANTAQANGTAGSGTHIIPAARVQEKVWTPEDILGAVNAATTATGENLAQRLIGRDFTPDQLQAIANTLNVASQQQANADVAGVLAQQQSDITTANAAYGQPADIAGAGTVSPQQVYQQVIAQGGSATQAAAAGAMVTGIESNGQLNDQNPKSTASGLFQFLTTTWQGYGGTKYAPTAGAATMQQQIDIFIKASAHGFSDWAPDFGAQWGQNPTAPLPGSKIANAVGQLGLSSMPQPTSTSGGKPDNPFPTGKQGRTDQGVDYSGSGNLYPTGAGTIVHVQTSGWGSLGNAGQGALIAVKLDHPADPQHSVVYYAENIIPNVRVGQHVQPGQVIGRATGKGGGIEIGFADPNNPVNPLAPLNMNNTGAATPEGQNFASWLSTGTISGIAAGGNQGTTTDVYQQPVIDQVPANVDPTAAATWYAENTLAPQYQQNNLLKVFQQIEGSLKTPPTPNAHVRQTPISMKPTA